MYRFLFFLFFLFLNLSVLAQPHARHNMNSAKADTPSGPSPRSSQSKDDARIAVNVPIEQQTRIGLKVSKVGKRDVVRTIRTIGTVTADETKEYHFHTKINGWVEKVYADYVGRRIRKGEPLFDLYSPDLVTTQEELEYVLKNHAYWQSRHLPLANIHCREGESYTVLPFHGCNIFYP
jgi:hypothetical protein